MQPPKPAWWKRIAAAIGFPVWVFVGFVVAQLIIRAVLEMLLSLGIDVSGAAANMLLSAIVYATTIAIVVGGPHLLNWRTSLKELGIDRPPRWYEFLSPLAGGVVYFLLSAVLAIAAMNFLPFIDFTQLQETGYGRVTAPTELCLAFVGIVIIAPLAEELLFRGYLFGKLRRYIPTWLAIFITSALFAAVHGQWNVAIDTFALSIILCLLRVTTGSIWPSILLHMLKNGVAFYFIFINPILL